MFSNVQNDKEKRLFYLLLLTNLLLVLFVSSIVLVAFFNVNNVKSDFSYNLQFSDDVKGMISIEDVYVASMTSGEKKSNDVFLISKITNEVEDVSLVNTYNGGTHDLAIIHTFQDNEGLILKKIVYIGDHRNETYIDSVMKFPWITIMWQSNASNAVFTSYNLLTEETFSSLVTPPILSDEIDLTVELSSNFQTQNKIYLAQKGVNQTSIELYIGGELGVKVSLNGSINEIDIEYSHEYGQLLVLLTTGQLNLPSFEINTTTISTVLLGFSPGLSLEWSHIIETNGVETNLTLSVVNQKIMVTGISNATNFPRTHFSDPSNYRRNNYTLHNKNDIFMQALKLSSPQKIETVWSQIFSTNGTDTINNSVSSGSNILMVYGQSNANDFPLWNSYFPNIPSNRHHDGPVAFIMEVNDEGELVYSSYSPFTANEEFYVVEVKQFIYYHTFSSNSTSTTIKTSISDNPLADFDGDQLPNGFEVQANADPTDPTDIRDDGDKDGLHNTRELLFHTRPDVPDTDFDSMPDGYEYNHFLDPLVDDRNVDTDLDGISNIDEYNQGLNPGDPDSDHDGDQDLDELSSGRDPTNNLDNTRSLYLIIISMTSLVLWVWISKYFQKVTK